MEYAKTTFTEKTADTDIIEVFEGWLKEAQIYHDEMLAYQKLAEAYYLGDQTNKDLIPAHRSNTVENRIFEAVETMVPIATASAHQFLALPPGNKEENKSKAAQLQKVLTRLYQILNIQEKLEDTTRSFMLYRFGVLKWGWNWEEDDIEVKVIDPRLILIPKLRIDPHRLPYVMEIQEYDREEMEENFPDADLNALGTESVVNVSYEKTIDKKVYRVYEIWTDEACAWICNKTVLMKKQNPYYDFTGEEHIKRTIQNLFKKKKEKETIYRNHLRNPEKPYVFFTTYKVSNTPVAPVSLIEIGISIQDSINVQKRQIIDNLRIMGNGQVYVDADAMSQEEADQITNEPGLIIRGEGVASQNKVRREPGVQLPNSHFSNLQHSEATFDNILGIHSATRGQANAKTLGQDILSRQQDFTRLDLITRVLNRGVSRLADGIVQTMKMFYDKNHLIQYIDEEGALELIPFMRDSIEDGVRIEVREGQTLSMDEVSLRNEGIQLWQLQAIDPVTLFERLKFPNPEKTAQRLLAWKQGQLTQDTMAKVAAATGGAQAKAALEPAPEGRGVETPMNSLQRSTANLGGTAPVAPGTPNL